MLTSPTHTACRPSRATVAGSRSVCLCLTWLSELLNGLPHHIFKAGLYVGARLLWGRPCTLCFPVLLCFSKKQAIEHAQSPINKHPVTGHHLVRSKSWICKVPLLELSLLLLVVVVVEVGVAVISCPGGGTGAAATAGGGAAAGGGG